MRKIVVSMWITLDGFVAGPGDEMDWLLADDRLQRYERELVESAGSLLLGRITHADFAGYWPKTARNPDEPEVVRGYAHRVDVMEKIVVSASGDTAPWPNTRRLARVDRDEINDLKQGPGGDVLVYGSLGVVRSLVDLDLVDELHLLVHPVFLRQGKALFTGDRRPVRLGLLSAEPFASGVVLMRYGPIGEARGDSPS
ncbi:dihydrofolate reductase family protein [Sphaerisporangium sp. TRM90804]|uniref:dihydrofolate reductase family protein n=1 Tax=Sphaerisporangium sp. TRM90804 TaxID=3031113 RepID=UPI0024495432|nr:dihydrofolate reductase family protein [Sphaerisporangium sp. TRM90804]MDH2430341.1 dihydrofolate reductase family protein [Sphaerisporangium sp. TRM90804]